MSYNGSQSINKYTYEYNIYIYYMFNNQLYFKLLRGIIYFKLLYLRNISVQLTIQ